MKVELLVTLKGEKVWKKGLILDSEKAPIPLSILNAIRRNTGTVKLIEGELSSLGQPAISETNKSAPESPAGAIDEKPVDQALEVTNLDVPQIPAESPVESTPEEQEIEKSTENNFECDLCDHKPFRSQKGLDIHTAKMHRK